MILKAFRGDKTNESLDVIILIYHRTTLDNTLLLSKELNIYIHIYLVSFLHTLAHNTLFRMVGYKFKA